MPPCVRRITKRNRRKRRRNLISTWTYYGRRLTLTGLSIATVAIGGEIALSHRALPVNGLTREAYAPASDSPSTLARGRTISWSRGARFEIQATNRINRQG